MNMEIIYTNDINVKKIYKKYKGKENKKCTI